MLKRQKKEKKQVAFRDADGQALTGLVSTPKADTLLRGLIVSTAKSEGQRRHFEIYDIEEREDTRVALCRPITPQGYKVLILSAGLLAGWFIVRYLLSFAGIGG